MKKIDSRLGSFEILGKLECAYSEKQLSKEEYEMWENVNANEIQKEESIRVNSTNGRRIKNNMH